MFDQLRPKYFSPDCQTSKTVYSIRQAVLLITYQSHFIKENMVYVNIQTEK